MTFKNTLMRILYPKFVWVQTTKERISVGLPLKTIIEPYRLSLTQNRSPGSSFQRRSFFKKNWGSLPV